MRDNRKPLTRVMLVFGAAMLGAALVAVPETALAAGHYVAVDDHYSTTQSVKTAPLNILANDDTDGESLTYAIVTPPQHGALSFEIGTPGGTVVFTPAPGFSGVDTFEYCLARLAGSSCISDLASVSITIAPAVPKDDLLSTPQGTSLEVTPQVLMANDDNASYPAFAVKIVEAPRFGALSTSGPLTYTPQVGFHGTDTLVYCLITFTTHPCESDSATAFINVGLPTTSRLSGVDRFEVAVNIADASFPTSAPVLFIASGVNYPDALSAAPAAVKLGAPLLLTLPDRIPDGTATKISELRPGRIVVVGGPHSISESVLARLKALVPGATVERVTGADRFGVSRAVADLAFGAFAHAFVTTGGTFADALSSGAAAGAGKEPVVLVNGTAPATDQPTLDLFARHATAKLTIVGGTNSVSMGVETTLASVAQVNRIGGADRYEASYNVNHAAFTKADTVYLATGQNYPDALAGGVLAGSTSSPLYVVPKSCIPQAVIDDIVRLSAKNVVLLGGPDSLTEDVAHLIPCPA